MLQIERKTRMPRYSIKLIRMQWKEVGGRLLKSSLVDNEGRITEGSKSNLFVIKSGRVVTAPESPC